MINIIKPYIFLLEILKKSFEKLGYTLEGDILNDDDFRFLALDNEGTSYEEFKFEELKEITTLSLPLDEEIIKVKFKTVGGIILKNCFVQSLEIHKEGLLNKLESF